MAEQQMKVSLSFSADTAQAKQQLMDLKNTLSSLSSFKFTGANGISGITQETLNAGKAASQLKLSLEAATNVNTGKLNLTKFSQEMDRTGMSFKKYRDALLELGPEGAEAFSQLTDSVLRADSAIGVGSKKLNDFFTTLKNTAKWQISSNIMHGFEGALKSAYGYAQDLNKSLNDIRIVTGYNTDKMAEFADQANRAAKNLSSTTLDYTDASLIYYQQGLSDSEVQARTETTVKMANVTGQSAQMVSDQMTAVWNNFDDGSKSLEYYADVMTALGAATASSTDEIATGLEKFAAISETVGLSYEYATAALATVTDKTRQSAEVVGTAFKTMFARIQGLKLGEILEDGTDLNQYSEALLAVGVNIKDANGQLKDMDQILNEMAGVWETLNRDEQVALAQKVAGVRQYNQLISLMENWDAMETNLAVAQGSEGALQDQADIYAESWEAASKRVKAATEGIYQDLINDDAFIDILNAFEDILTFIDSAIKGLGGLEGVLTAVLAIATKLFSGQIATSMNSMKDSLQSMTKSGRAKVESRREEALKAAGTLNVDMANEEGNVVNQAYADRAKLQTILLDNAKNMSEQELAINQMLLDGNKVLADRAAQRASEYDKSSDKQLQQSLLISGKIRQGGGTDDEVKKFTDASENYQTFGKLLNKNKIAFEQLKAAKKKFDDSNKKVDTKQYTEAIKSLGVLKTQLSESGKLTTDAEGAINKYIQSLENGIDVEKTFKDAIDYCGDHVKLNSKHLAENENTLREFANQFQISENEIDSFVISLQDLISKGYTLDQALLTMGKSTDKLVEDFNKAKDSTLDFGQKVTTLVNLGSSMQMIANSVSGLADSLTDADMSGAEKMEAVFASLLSIMPALMMAYESFDKIKQSSLGTDMKKIIATAKETAEEKKLTGAKRAGAIATEVSAKALKAHPVMWILSILMAVISAVTAINGIIEANTQRIQENAEAAREKAQASQEELDKAKEATKVYEEQYEAFKKGEIGRDDLRKAAEELIEVYDDENLKILAQTGQYEELIKKIKQARLEKLKEARADAENSKEANQEAFEDSMTRGQGYDIGDKYNVSFSANIGDDSLLQEKMSENKDLKYLQQNEDGTIAINVDKSQMGDVYKEIQGFIDSLNEEFSSADLETSSLYNDLTSWLNKAEEDYANFAESAENTLSLDIEIAYLDPEQNFGDNIESAENLIDYQKARDNLINSIANSQGITDKNSEAWKNLKQQVSNYLYSIEKVANFEGATKWYDNLDQTYEGKEDLVKEIKEFYKSVPKEDKVLVSQIDFNVYKSKEAMQFALDQLKSYAKSENIETKLNVVREAQSDYDSKKGLDEEGFNQANSTLDSAREENEKLKELYAERDQVEEDFENATDERGKSILARRKERLDEEISALEESLSVYKELLSGQDELNYSEFLLKTKAEQVEYLNQLERAQSEALIKEAEQRKNTTQEELNVQSKTLEELKAKREEIQEALDKISDPRGKSAYISSNNIDLNKLDEEIEEAQEQLDGLFEEFENQNLELELQIKLEGEERIKDLLTDFEKVKNINDDIRDNIEQVGNSYILTAEQALEWANVYPEILANAEVAANGTIELNAAEVNSFIEGKEVELMTSGEAEIARLEMEKAGLEAAKARAEAEIELANAVANGETEITADQFEWKINASNILTDALIQNGISEVDANKLAMAAMAGNQEEYDRIVGEVTQNMSDNMKESAKASMKNVYIAMNSAGQDVADFASTCHQAAQAFAGIGEGKQQGDATNQVSGESGEPGFTAEINYVSGDFKGSEYEYEEQQKTLEEFIFDKQLEVEGFDKRIGEINSKIAEIRAGMEKSFDSYTPDVARPTDDKSGGSDKKKEGKELKEIADRYHEINEEIEAQEHALTMLEKIKSKAYGPNKIKVLAEERKQYEGLLKNQEDLLSLQEGFLTVDAANIESLFGQGSIDFDKETGNIANYSQLVQQAYNEMKIAKEAYESSEQTEDDEKAYEEAQKAYDKKIEALEQYEETLDGVRESEEKVLDTQQKLDEIDLEAITYTVDLNIEAIDFKLELLYTYLEELENKAFSTADAIAQLGQVMNEVLGMDADGNKTGEGKNDQYLFGINEVLSKKLSEEEMQAFNEGNIEGIDLSKLSADDISQLKSYAEGLMSTNEELANAKQKVNDSLTQAFDEWSELYDEHLGEFDHLDSVLNSYDNIIDLSGYSSAISTKDRKAYNNLKTENANNKVTSAKSAFDEAKENAKLVDDELKDAKRRLKEAKKNKDDSAIKAAEDDIATWENAQKTAQENVKKYEQEFLDSWETALQTARDVFIANAELEMKDLEKQMAGTYGTIEEMQKSFDRSQEVDDRYLDDYEKLYELNKLNRDLEKQMDGAASIKAKEKLLKLQEKINNYQAEGVEMSKYDLEYLQKEYDLELAKIAMEEAQNAKSQVRLTQDAEGNYSYTYTADEEASSEAQQNYEDKLYETTVHSEEYMKQQSANIIQTQQEMLDAITQINQNAADGLYASDEEYKKALADTQAYYTGLLQYYSSEVDKASLNNTIIYGREYASYAGYADATMSEMDRLKAAQEGMIMASAAEVEKLKVSREAAVDHLNYLYQSNQISEQEYLEAKAQTNKTYAEQISLETQTAEENTQKALATLRDNGLISYQDNYVDKVIAKSGEVVNAELGIASSFKEMLPGLETDQKTASGYVDDMVKAIGDPNKKGKDGGALGKLGTGFDNMQSSINTAITNAGIDLSAAAGEGSPAEKFAEGIGELMVGKDGKGGVKKRIKDTADGLGDVKEKSDELPETIGAVGDWQRKYSYQIQLTIDKNKLLLATLGDIFKKSAYLAKTEYKINYSYKVSGEEPKGKDQHYTITYEYQTVGDTPKKTQLATEAAAIVQGVHNGSIKQTDSGWKPSAKAMGYSDEAISLALKAINDSKSGQGYDYYYEKALELANSYDTGGYTGVWGPDGKLAILHQKELILNATDTENMLAAVSMIREISKMIDLQAYQSQIQNSFAMNAIMPQSNKEQIVQQTVEIKADFPGVTSHNEIEEALNNLMNTASQYAFRRY